MADSTSDRTKSFVCYAYDAATIEELTALVALEPMDSNAEVQAAVGVFLASLRSHDWATFENCFDPNAAIITETGDPQAQRVQTWPDVSARMRQLFTRAQATKAPLLAAPIAFRDLTFDIRGGIAMVGVRKERRQSSRVLVLASVNGRWLVRHLNATALGMDAL